MMTDQNLQNYLTTWRQAEDKYYGAVLSAPELYTAALQLVRGIADSMKDIDTVETLFEAYPGFTIAAVTEIGEALALTRRDFLDYHLARDAAFHLRHREILETQAKREIQANIAEATAAGEQWVTLYNTEHVRQGVTFFQRLEMHLPEGRGLYSAIELDWEKGRVYVLEPLLLDPATGELQRQARPAEPHQEFTTQQELALALDALRQKYSVDDSTSDRGNP